MCNVTKNLNETESETFCSIPKPILFDTNFFPIPILFSRGERERLFGSREREGKLKITFPFYGKGTGIRKCYGKGREWEI